MHGVIATSNRLGHPDILSTLTCGQKWTTVARDLLSGQKSRGRLDIRAKVFHIKLRALLYFLTDEKFFEDDIASFKVIEFEKQGLPHVRCIFILSAETKAALVQPEYVRMVIYAEVRSIQNRTLREVVLKHKLHQPGRSFILLRSARKMVTPRKPPR